MSWDGGYELLISGVKNSGSTALCSSGTLLEKNVTLFVIVPIKVNPKGSISFWFSHTISIFVYFLTTVQSLRSYSSLFRPVHSAFINHIMTSHYVQGQLCHRTLERLAVSFISWYLFSIINKEFFMEYIYLTIKIKHWNKLDYQ